MKNYLVPGITERRGEQGASAVFVAVVLSLLLFFTALAIDVGHLYGVRNELHNSADAGALAGAAFLFDDNGNLTRDAAIAEAARVTQLHKSGTAVIDDYVIETGHWSFGSKTFTANPATVQLTGWQGMSAAVWDANTGFINAVRVYSNRPDAPSFFARLLGFAQFFVGAEGVAWIGPSVPYQFDLPIALCEHKISDINGTPLCDQARMANSGNNPSTNETAMWTNFTQDNPDGDPPTTCETASASDMKDLTDTDSCGNINRSVYPGMGMGVQNGVQDTVFSNIVDCWAAKADGDGDGIPDKPWSVTLPVVDCFSSETCAMLVGGAVVDIYWMVYKNDPEMNDVPTKMLKEDGSYWGPTECPDTTTYEARFNCWKSFVDTFKLENANGDPLNDTDYETMYQMRNIFFKARCDVFEPNGTSGVQNFGGKMAEIPKLVK